MWRPSALLSNRRSELSALTLIVGATSGLQPILCCAYNKLNNEVYSGGQDAKIKVRTSTLLRCRFDVAWYGASDLHSKPPEWLLGFTPFVWSSTAGGAPGLSAKKETASHRTLIPSPRLIEAQPLSHALTSD